MLINFLWLLFQPRLYLYVGTLYLLPTPTLNWLSPLFNVRYAYTRHPSSGSFHFVGSLKHQLRLSFQPAIPVSLSSFHQHHLGKKTHSYASAISSHSSTSSIPQELHSSRDEIYTICCSRGVASKTQVVIQKDVMYYDYSTWVGKFGLPQIMA